MCILSNFPNFSHAICLWSQKSELIITDVVVVGGVCVIVDKCVSIDFKVINDQAFKNFFCTNHPSAEVRRR